MAEVSLGLGLDAREYRAELLRAEQAMLATARRLQRTAGPIFSRSLSGIDASSVTRELGRAERAASEVQQELGDVRRELGRVGAGASRSGDQMTRSYDRAERGARDVRRELGRVDRAQSRLANGARRLGPLLAAVLSIEGARRFGSFVIAANDSFASQIGLLGQVSNSLDDAVALQRELFELSQETRVATEPTARLYARIAGTAEELGVNQQQLLDVTRAINQSFAISGATQQEVASVSQQLSQALGSGTLRGEELNAVLDGNRRLAKAIAEQLGVGVGQLRELAEAGELTSARVFQALLNSTEQFNEEFAKIPTRVEQVTVQISDAFSQAFASADAEPLVSALEDIRDAIKDPEIAASLGRIAGFVISISAGFLRLGPIVSVPLDLIRGGARLIGIEIAKTTGAIGALFNLLTSGDLSAFNRRIDALAETAEEARRDIFGLEKQIEGLTGLEVPVPDTGPRVDAEKDASLKIEEIDKAAVKSKEKAEKDALAAKRKALRDGVRLEEQSVKRIADLRESLAERAAAADESRREGLAETDPRALELESGLLRNRARNLASTGDQQGALEAAQQLGENAELLGRAGAKAAEERTKLRAELREAIGANDFEEQNRLVQALKENEAAIRGTSDATFLAAEAKRLETEATEALIAEEEKVLAAQKAKDKALADSIEAQKNQIAGVREQSDSLKASLDELGNVRPLIAVETNIEDVAGELSALEERIVRLPSIIQEGLSGLRDGVPTPPSSIESGLPPAPTPLRGEFDISDNTAVAGLNAEFQEFKRTQADRSPVVIQFEGGRQFELEAPAGEAQAFREESMKFGRRVGT